jgi:hypothetical protein
MAVGCLAGVLSGGTTEDPIVTDWVERTVVASGSVSASTRALIDDYIKGCKADGYWDVLANGLILPFASDGFFGCFVPLVLPLGAVISPQNFVAGDYSLATGLDPGLNNTTKQIQTNIQAQQLFAASNLQFTQYKRSSRVLSASSAAMSVNMTSTSSRIAVIEAPSGATAATFDAFNSTAGRLSATSGSKTPLRVSSARWLSGRRSWLFNGVEHTFNTTSGGTFPSTSSVILMGTSGSSNRCSNILSYIYAGRGLTNAQETQHVARINALQTGLGRAV